NLDAELDDTVAAKRPITLDDLLTSRLGFGVVLAPPDAYPIQRAEAALELRSIGPPWPPTPHTPDEWIAAFPTLPLVHQPAAGWLLSTIDDFAAFVRMLLRRGVGDDGTALISEESVARMLTDQLTAAQRDAARRFVGEAGGWGYGLTVPAAGVSDVAVGEGIG